MLWEKEDGPLLQKALWTSKVKGEKTMNDIIKKIEDEQLKAQAPEFRVGDTVKV